MLSCVFTVQDFDARFLMAMSKKSGQHFFILTFLFVSVPVGKNWKSVVSQKNCGKTQLHQKNALMLPSKS